jgi:hypothetical protein
MLPRTSFMAALLVPMLCGGDASAARAQQAGDPLREVAMEVYDGRTGGVPTLVLAMRTAQEFGCLGFAIRHSYALSGRTIVISLTGVEPPGGEVCLTAEGPATMSQPLAIAPGTYALLVMHGGATDRHRLEVTSRAARLVPLRRSFTTAETRPSYRIARNSFFVECGNLEDAAPVCDELIGWVARQPGITRIPIPADGRHPYLGRVGTPEDERAAVFGYADANVIARLRGCVARLEPYIRESVGIVVKVETWTGERFQAYSSRSWNEPNRAPPEHAVALAGCG